MNKKIIALLLAASISHEMVGSYYDYGYKYRKTLPYLKKDLDERTGDEYGTEGHHLYAGQHTDE